MGASAEEPRLGDAGRDIPSDIDGISALRVTPQAVHLVLASSGDWEAARAETVAEVERLCDLAEAFAQSGEFARRFPNRSGVLRLVVQHAPPEIVRQVLTERGVEIEVAAESKTGDKSCELCQRQGLSDQIVSMTDEGWACPSCFRAWLARQDASRRPRAASLLGKFSNRLIFPLLLVIVALFVMGVLHELKRLNQASNIIRQHMPTQ